MNPLKLQIIIDAQNKSEQVMKQVSSQLGNIGQTVKDLKPTFTAMAAAGTAAFGAISGVVGISIANYIEAERSVRQLEHAVIDVSKGNKKQVDSILAVADALQKKSGIDGDALTMGAAQLSTFGLQTKSVLNLTKSLADLTVNQSGVNASADEYVQSANVIAKALNGQFGVLEKSGIRFTEAQQNLIQFGTEEEKVAALTEGLNQNLRETTDTIGNTAEGGLAKLKQSLGDISEAIGASFLPILENIVEKITPIVQKISEWASENPKLVAALLIAGAALGAIAAAIGTIGLVLPGIIAAFGLLSGGAVALGVGLLPLTIIVAAIAAAIAALIAIGYLLYKHWDEIKAAAGVVWDAVSAKFSEAFNKIQETVSTIWQTVQDIFWLGIDFIIGAAKMLLDFLLPGWEATFQGIWNTTMTILEAVKGFVSAAMSFILNSVIIPVLGGIKSVWDTIWGGIASAFSSVWEAIKGAAGGALEWIRNEINSLMGPLNSLLSLAERAISIAKSVGSGVGKAVGSVVSTGKSVTGRAIGGPVGTNHPYQVGENGPEMFWPTSAGRIIPAGAGGGSMNLTIMGNTFVGPEDFAEKIGNDIIKLLKQNIKL